ncbi:MAG: glycine betaine ABC transporter substrate-binding protein, partial [Propionibacteriaceae bacterium]|nr:glycine betaine ABC transporter substrate-binding protein [Propionibacteriaceae bacterium]
MSTPIVLGRIDESFHQVAAAVVEEVLVRLGHEVRVVEGAHPEMYPQLARGEQDLFADAWLPHGHEVYWEQIREVVTEVAPLYVGGLFFWAVPGYVPAELVSSLADLAKPEVAERFTTRVVQGTKAGAGLSMRSNRLVVEYGLDALGWSHEIGDIWTVIDTVNTRMAAGTGSRRRCGSRCSSTTCTTCGRSPTRWGCFRRRTGRRCWPIRRSGNGCRSA